MIVESLVRRFNFTYRVSTLGQSSKCWNANCAFHVARDCWSPKSCAFFKMMSICIWIARHRMHRCCDDASAGYVRIFCFDVAFCKLSDTILPFIRVVFWINDVADLFPKKERFFSVAQSIKLNSVAVPKIEGCYGCRRTSSIWRHLVNGGCLRLSQCDFESLRHLLNGGCACDVHSHTLNSETHQTEIFCCLFETLMICILYHVRQWNFRAAIIFWGLESWWFVPLWCAQVCDVFSCGV